MKTNYLIKHFIGTFLFFIIIFISAGRIDYWQGLIYVIIGLIMFLLNYTVLRIDSELLNERSKPGESTKKWDKTILGLSFLITISMYITAGLDSGRYHWSPNFHWGICLLGIILTILGQLLFLILKSKINFSQVQSEFKLIENILFVKLDYIKLLDIQLIWVRLFNHWDFHYSLVHFGA